MYLTCYSELMLEKKYVHYDTGITVGERHRERHCGSKSGGGSSRSICFISFTLGLVYMEWNYDHLYISIVIFLFLFS